MDNMERVYAAIDAQNLFFSARKLCTTETWKVDYKKLYNLILSNRLRRKIVKAKVFIADARMSSNFESYVKSNGFEAYVSYSYEISSNLRKSIPWNIGIAVDALVNIEAYDTYVLCGGDGEFIYLFDELKRNNKKIELICFDHSVNKELFQLIDEIKFLDKSHLIIEKGELHDGRN